jgi:hypothetical protein
MKNVKVKLTGIVVKEGDDLKKRLKETRLFLRKSPDKFGRMSMNTVYTIERTGLTMRIGTLRSYMEGLGLKKITFVLSQTGYHIECHMSNLGRALKYHREKLGITQYDVMKPPQPIVSRLESYEDEGMVRNYTEYAKALKIKQLTIII